jgi:hypothetical protein
MTMEARLAASVAEPRFYAVLLGLFALLALALALAGLYGVLSYLVAERRREIGIRMALGADQTQVQRLVFRQGFTLIAIGTVLGLIGALATSRLLTGLLFGVTPSDPATYVAVPLLALAPGRRGRAQPLCPGRDLQCRLTRVDLTDTRFPSVQYRRFASRDVSQRE